MARLAFVCILLLAAADIKLEDGVTEYNEVTSSQGGEVLYSFYPAYKEFSRPLAVILTKFSDTSDPAMYMKTSPELSASYYDWKSETRGDGLFLFERNRFSHSTYYVLVICSAPCSYAIAYFSNEPLRLMEDVPRIIQSTSREIQITNENKANIDAKYRLTIVPYAKDWFGIEKGTSSILYPFRQESWSSLSDANWPFQFEIKYTIYSKYELLVITIQQEGNIMFMVSVVEEGQALRLLPSFPVSGTAGLGEFSYYKLNATAAAEAVFVKMTTFSGGGSLFLKKGEKPTLVDFDQRSETAANDTILLRRGSTPGSRSLETGVYYIGVYSHTPTAFTISASLNFSSCLPIHPGLPHSDEVADNASRNFYVDVPTRADSYITFQARPIQGRTSLYVQLCTHKDLAYCEFQRDVFINPWKYPTLYYSTSSEGDDFVSIKPRGESCEESCRYIIAVTGKDFGASRFVLSVSFDERKERHLMHGVPAKTTMPKAGYSYFRYTVFDDNVNSVVFQLTSSLNDPDFFVFHNYSFPSVSSDDRSSNATDSMLNLVSYSKGSASLLNEYDIAVYAAEQTVFSLVAYERAPGRYTAVFLYPGEPQMATVHLGKDTDYHLFKFEPHCPHGESISVSLTPVTGSFRLYAAKLTQALELLREEPTYHWGSSYANHSDTVNSIIIRPDDCFNLAKSMILVKVQGKEFTANRTATFVISYRSSSDLLSLQESIPHTDEVAAGQYKYYTFPVYYAHGDVKIQLTAITGDPDLYVLINAPKLPTKTMFHFSSVVPAAGSTVSILWEEIKRFCPEQPKEVGLGGKGNCYFRIGVYGYSASHYTIAITSHKSMPSLLPLSTPSTGQLSRTLYDYYYTLVTTTASLYVRLQRIYGDSELRLNLIDYGERSSAVSEWRRPNQTVADYTSQFELFSSSIRIGKDELSDRCKIGTCIALAGVYCASEICKYALATSQDQVPLVIEGLPTYGQVHSGLYVYYKFFNHQDSASLQLTLMPLNNGDLDLVVSRGADKRPTEDNCDWSSQSRRSEILTISPSDRFFSSTSSMRGYYTIGVRGYHNVTFSLTVTTSTESMTQIVAGAPVKSKVEQWEAKFFSYFNYRQTDVDIVLTPLYGAVALRVNRFYIGSADLNGNLPNRYNSTWSSAVSGYQNRLTIPTSSPSYCTNCMLLIGVFADLHSCAFSLSVTSGKESLLLLNGISVQGQVGLQAWRYYTFYLDTQSDLDICVTNYAGNADVYVSFGAAVDINTATWKQTTNQHVKHMHIRTSDSNYGIGQYAIGVLGEKSASYAITAHVRDSHITLVDGWPQVYSIMHSSEDQLTFEYYILNAVRKTQIACRVQVLSDGFWPAVDVEYESFSSFKADSGHAVQHYSEKDYDRVYQRLSFELTVPQTLGKYLVSLSGQSAGGMSSSEAGSFEIACFGQGNSTVLLQGREGYGSLSSTAPRQRFEIYVSEPALLEVLAEPCAGHLSMSISSNYTAEEDSGSVITVSSVTDGRLQATVMKAWGQYFVTLKLLDPAEEAVFQVSYQYYVQNAARPKSVVPGNDGLLRWTTVDAETIQLMWTVPMRTDGTAIGEQIQYVVYITNTKKVKMATVCGMRAGEDQSLAWQNDAATVSATSSKVRVQPGQTQYVNVIAILSASDGSTRQLPYTPTEVLIQLKQPKGGMILLIFISAFALAAVLGCLYFVWKKYRKAKTSLENEMQDVRKVASLSSDSIISGAEEAPSRPAAYQSYQSLELISSR